MTPETPSHSMMLTFGKPNHVCSLLHFSHNTTWRTKTAIPPLHLDPWCVYLEVSLIQGDSLPGKIVSDVQPQNLSFTFLVPESYCGILKKI